MMLYLSVIACALITALAENVVPVSSISPISGKSAKLLTSNPLGSNISLNSLILPAFLLATTITLSISIDSFHQIMIICILKFIHCIFKCSTTCCNSSMLAYIYGSIYLFFALTMMSPEVSFTTS